MAVVRGGLLGSFSGKVGGLVGGRWKDIQYARGYVKPANPNTDSQQYYRARFKEIANFAISILGSVLQEYMDGFVRSMSAYNWFMKRNTPNKNVDWDPQLAVLTEGPLFPAAALSTQYGTGYVEVTTSNALGNNGLATDLVYGVAQNVDTGAFVLAEAEALRSAQAVRFHTSGNMNLNIYIITCRRDEAGNVTKIGTSQFIEHVSA